MHARQSKMKLLSLPVQSSVAFEALAVTSRATRWLVPVGPLPTTEQWMRVNRRSAEMPPRNWMAVLQNQKKHQRPHPTRPTTVLSAQQSDKNKSVTRDRWNVQGVVVTVVVY